MSFRALHVIPSTTRNLPPSLRVRGLGGCSYPPSQSARGQGDAPTRHSRAGGNPEGTGWENHGNHYPIMAIMVQNLALRIHTMSFRAQRGISNVILAQARIQSGREGKIMAIITPSWQSRFKTSPLRIHTMSFRAQRGISNVIPAPTRHSREGENPEWMGEGRTSPLRTA